MTVIMLNLDCWFNGVLIVDLISEGSFSLGTKIPPYATVIFDVLLVDVFNVKDDVMIEVEEIPRPCRRRASLGDFIRYHYNGSFQDGTLFDSRSEQTFLSK